MFNLHAFLKTYGKNLVIFTFFLASGMLNLQAQFTGGYGKGTATPGKTEKSELTSGAVSGGANLFTGTLEMGYDFGSLSTLSGLSFPLKLSYSSSTLTSFDPPHNSGIPYGEGWNLSQGYISCDHFGFEWLSSQSTVDGYDNLGNQLFTKAETKRDGRVFFSNPTVHLPGVSGRLVYKYPHPNIPDVQVYVLNKFETYVEAHFDGENWKLILPDGTIYSFTVKQYRQRNPTGNLAHADSLNGDHIVPPAQVDRWYLSEISNPNHASGQRIVFDYYEMGALDFHTEFQQHNVNTYLDPWNFNSTRQVILNADNFLHLRYLEPCASAGIPCQLGDTITLQPSPYKEYTAFRDVFLKEVYSTDIEGIVFQKVELKHRTWSPDYELQGDPDRHQKLQKGRFVQLGDDYTWRVDSLYTAQNVWWQGADHLISRHHHLGHRPDTMPSAPFDGWKRYQHPFAHQNPLIDIAGGISRNTPFAAKFPFLTNQGVPGNNYCLALQDVQVNGAPKFAHSVLESPRLTASDLVTGDLYQFRTTVKVPSGVDMNFDLQVVSGLNTNLTPTSSYYYQGSYNGQTYTFMPEEVLFGFGSNAPQAMDAYEKGYTLYSSMQKPVKWNPSYGWNNPIFHSMGATFQMPNLPNDFDGVNLQVGPAADNTDHWKSRRNGQGYYQYYNNVDSLAWFNYDNRYSPRTGRFFGTGAPVQPFYIANRFWAKNRASTGQVMSLNKGPQGTRNQYWHYPFQTAYDWNDVNIMKANQPTAVTKETVLSTQNGAQRTSASLQAIHQTNDSELWNVELVRISKNPWMLDSVLFWQHHESYGQDMTLIGVYKLNYNLEQIPILNNRNDWAQNPIPNTGLWKMAGNQMAYRNLFQLKSIARLPIDSVNNAYRNGELPTTHFEYYSPDSATPYIEEANLLKTVWNELGGKQEFEYYPTNDTLEIGNTKVPFNSDGTLRYAIIGAGRIKRQDFRLKFRIVEDENGQHRWFYEYQNPVKMYAHFNLNKNFRRGSVSRVTEPIQGHQKTIVHRPSPDGQPIFARTEYSFFTYLNSLEDTLLFGKVRQVKEYDGLTSWISKNTTEYRITKAYTSGHFLSPASPVTTASGGKATLFTPNSKEWDYDGAYLRDSRGLLNREDVWRNHSWFVRPVKSQSTTRDPITGNTITSTVEFTHYDWNDSLQDLDDDYLLLYNEPTGNRYLDPVYSDSAGNFSYGPEPSWQVAAKKSSVDAMPGAYSVERYVYLWDIGPFLQESYNPNRFLQEYRPYSLAKLYGIRNTPVEVRTTTHNGDPHTPSHTQSMYYWFDIFRDVSGSFETIIDSTNLGAGSGTGGQVFIGDKQVVAYCFGAGEARKMDVVTAEVKDDPRYVQDTSGHWWFFPIEGYKIMTLGEVDSLPRFSDSPFSVDCESGVVLDACSEPKYFGSLELGGGGTIKSTALQPARLNYGQECHETDSITAFSKKKCALICNDPYKHGVDSVCHIVEAVASDSLLNVILDPDSFPGPSPNYLILGDVLANQFFLRAVYVQADTLKNSRIDDCLQAGTTTPTGNPTRYSIHDVFTKEATGSPYVNRAYEYRFRPNFSTIRVYKVHERNQYGQVIDESDARRLHTVYEYSRGTAYIWFDSSGTRMTDVKRLFPGYPLSVTVTDRQDDILHTSIFEYYRDYSLQKIISPNQEFVKYEYDDFGRLTGAYLNGDLVEEYAYHKWQNDRSLSFTQKIPQNYVHSIVHDGKHQGQELNSLAYMNPLGRVDQVITAVNTPSGWDKQFSGEVEFDFWGRALRSNRPWYKSGQPNLGYDPSAPATSFGEVQYERDSRSRPLKNAKPGNPINGGHVQAHSYATITLNDFQNETGATPSEIKEMFPYLNTLGIPVGGIANLIKIIRAESIDEDGKGVVFFSNAIGQEIATLSWEEAGRGPGTEVTVFNIYDPAGRTRKVIHPNKLGSFSKFNHIGMPYETTTPDQGTKRMLYNQAGDLKVVQDENLRAENRMLVFEYDKLGRLIREKTVTFGGSMNSSFWLNGSPTGGKSVDLLDYDDPDFRSIYSIYEEVDALDPRDEDTNIDEGAGFCSGEGTFSRMGIGRGNLQKVAEYRYDEQFDVVKGQFEITVNQNLMSPQVRQRMGGQSRLVTRLAIEKLYDHLGALTEINYFSYDERGNPQWYIKQFSPSGIAPTHQGRVDFLSYPDYDLAGKLLTMNIDVNMDYNLDLQQHFEYDPYGRLSKVFASDADVKDQGTRVCSYEYNDTTGVLCLQKNYVWSDTCGVYYVADSVVYARDHQDRLTSIDSWLMSYDLYYDDGSPNRTGIQAIFPGQVRHDRNWNGNLNAWKVKYHVSQAGVSGFSFPTKYGFIYDWINRLTHADATVEENILPPLGRSFDLGTGFGSPIPRLPKAWFGDAMYEYDKVGNLTGLRRYGYRSPGQSLYHPGENWNYAYYSGTNQLQKLMSVSTPNVDFGYDGNGNLLLDSKKGVSGFSYNLSNLPVKFSNTAGTTMRYHYGSNGQRNYKRIELANGKFSSEYYLRDASGKTLGIFDIEKRKWDWFLYGAGMIAEWAAMDSVVEDSSSGNGGLGQTGTSTNKGEFLANRQRRRRNAMRAFLVSSPSLIPVAIEIAEGGLAPFTLPVAVVMTPILNEMAVYWEERILGKMTDPVADPRPLSVMVQDSTSDTLLTDLKFFLKDHLGNTRVTYVPFVGTDPVTQQKCVLQYYMESVVDYYPYGKELRTWYAKGNERYLSTEHERDVETGLDYRGARFYDSDYGRFLGVDPLAGQQLALGPFNYVNGNPAILVDPDGRMADIVIHGKNNSSITIKTDISDQELNTDDDFGGNFVVPFANVAHLMGADSPHFSDGSNFALGIFASGKEATHLGMVHHELGGVIGGVAFSDHRIDQLGATFSGIEGGGGLGLGIGIGGEGELGIFYAQYIGGSNDPEQKVASFVGPYDYISFSANAEALLGLGIDLQVSYSRDWINVSAALEGGIGLFLSVGNVIYGKGETHYRHKSFPNWGPENVVEEFNKMRNEGKIP